MGLIEKVKQLIELAEWEKFWYEASGIWHNRFDSLFIGNKEIKKFPRLNFENCTVMAWMCQGSSVESVDYYISGPISNACRSFALCSNLTFVYGIDLSKATEIKGLFLGSNALITVQEPLDLSSATSVSDAFNCTSLQNITFNTETIKVSIAFTSAVLSDESIQSIIDGLATVETAQTLTLNSKVKAKLTDTQLNEITNKNWNLA